MIGGIYKIINIATNMFYIGSTYNFDIRWSQHKNLLLKNNHKNKFLQHSWNKYWEHNFRFEVIEYCEKENLIEREQYWLDQTKCYQRNIGYNLTPTAGNNFGYKQSEETKLKRANSLRGKKRSTETKLKMSLASLGKPKSKQHAEKLRNYKHSEKDKLKMSLSRIGKKHTKNTKEKMSKIHTNIWANRLSLELKNNVRY